MPVQIGHKLHRNFPSLMFLLLASLPWSHSASAHTVSLNQVAITIETRIDPPDPQAGMKSVHKIIVNFNSESLQEQFSTGTTTIFGTTFSSIRNNFRSQAVKWDRKNRGSGHRVVTLSISGHTASGVRVLPGIDYRFSIHLTDSREIRIDGCHDGYPSYSIKVDGSQKYYHKHKPTRLYKLFGRCDVKVLRKIGEHHGWGF